MNVGLPQLPKVRKGLLRPPVLSWALYDFANTIFSMNVLSLYFALWVTVDHGASDLVYSLAFSGSMLAVALTAPMLGAVSDRYRRRIPFLAFFTISAVAFTAPLAFVGNIAGLVVALLFFAVANFAYQSGNIFYDALLPTVSQEDRRGRVSGLGVALGYVGSFAGIIMVAPFVEMGGRGAAFLPTAVLFLVFALPCFLLVKEARSDVAWSRRLFKEGYSQILTTLRNARGHSNILRFIGARFLYVDAVNTLLTFMAVYATRVIGFSDESQIQLFGGYSLGEVQSLLLFSTAFAMVGSLLFGQAADRIGPKKTLIIVLTLWVLVFISAAGTFYRPAFWAIGAVAGIALGGMWTADRAFLTRLAPPHMVGEFFGLYRLAGRFAAVVGPLLWGVTLWALADLGQLSFRIAILVLLLNVVLGFMLLMTVKERQEPQTGPSPPGGTPVEPVQ